MRILAVTNLFPPFHAGGYGILCHRLCECMKQAGHDVTVLTSISNGKRPDPGGLDVCLPVWRKLAFVEGLPAGLLFRNTLRNKRIVSRCIRTFEPDLVVCFGVDGIGYQVYHTAVESGVPSVTVAGDTWLGQAWRDLPKFDPWHALAAGRNSRGIQRLVKRGIGYVGQILGLYTGIRPRSARPVYAISSFLMDDLKSAGMSWTPFCHLIKYPLLPPFVSEDGVPVGLDGSGSPCLRVLFLSRMEPLKGPDIAIKGVAAAIRRGADVRLTLAGIGAEYMKADLSRLALDLGISECVHWADAPDQGGLVALYRAHDVFVFPSLITEGLGIVCLEAMACGLPVVATGLGGQLDLVKDGQTGFTFAPGDNTALAEILTSLAGDISLRRKLSCGAIDMAQAYSSAVVREEIAHWINEPLSLKKRFLL